MKLQASFGEDSEGRMSKKSVTMLSGRKVIRVRVNDKRTCLITIES
jgi:hypothetical protein